MTSSHASKAYNKQHEDTPENKIDPSFERGLCWLESEQRTKRFSGMLSSNPIDSDNPDGNENDDNNLHILINV